MRFFSNSSRRQGQLLFAAFGLICACVSKKTSPSKSDTETVKSTTSAARPTEPVEVSAPGVCPEDSVYVSNPRRCITRGGVVLGPFPLELQELCRELFPSDAGICVQRQDWPLEFFDKLKEKYSGGCPPGGKLMPGGVCLSSGNVYGPFTQEQVSACRTKLSYTDQSPCLQMAWSEDLFERVQNEIAEKKKFAAPELKSGDGKSAPSSEGKLVPRKYDSGTPSQSDVRKIIVIDDGVDGRSAESQSKGSKTDAVESAKKKEAPASVEKPAPTPTAKPDPRKKVIKVPEPNPTPAREFPPAKPVVSEQQEPPVKAPTYCIYAWDERPGTADFSTRNERLASLSRNVTYPLDRPDSAALLRVPEFQAMDMCTRARFLKKCFQRVILESDSPAAQGFRAWSLGRVRPVEAHMAFVMKESRLGLWGDQCWKGQCKGVGIAKVSKARTPAGRWIVDDDPLWFGIAHNIMTNLEFSLRLLAESASAGPTDLYSLAYLHNGKSGVQERYALEVDKYYKELLGCQLDER
ncbi:MAG: hypothetical protein ACO3A4_02305 [Silvanigrellaceae bacterium]